MPKKLLHSDFNKRIEFGTIESTLNENTGGQNREFIPLTQVWCSIKTRSLNQMFSAKTAGLEDTITVIIRSNRKINESLIARLNGKTYRIENISVDESNNYMPYDFITMREINKAGE